MRTTAHHPLRFALLALLVLQLTALVSAQRPVTLEDGGAAVEEPVE